jgi:hypothetical protein
MKQGGDQTKNKIRNAAGVGGFLSGLICTATFSFISYVLRLWFRFIVSGITGMFANELCNSTD